MSPPVPEVIKLLHLRVVSDEVHNATKQLVADPDSWERVHVRAAIWEVEIKQARRRARDAEDKLRVAHWKELQVLLADLRCEATRIGHNLRFTRESSVVGPYRA